MAVLSPLQYRLHLLKEKFFGDKEKIYEILVCYRDKLPSADVQVSWTRDEEFIVGAINIDGEKYFTQARSADEFVEMVNDAIYAIYEVPPKYAELLGAYRLMPQQEAYEKLKNVEIKKSSFDFQVLTEKKVSHA